MSFDLVKEATIIGRDVTNDIVVGDAEVSRQHARLTYTPAGYVLEDLGSTNGTFVNGERLAAPRVLSPGDIIGLGENVALAYDAASPEAAATVMGAAAQRVPPAGRRTPPPPTPMPAARQAAYAAGPEPAAPAKRSGGSRWLLAGCGCLVLLVACAGILWYMDAYYPNILYAPLRMLGF
jgi:predicted component of type VI protein secretion system